MIILFINIRVSTMYQELLLVMSKTDLDSQPSWYPHSTEEKLDWYPRNFHKSFTLPCFLFS